MAQLPEGSSVRGFKCPGSTGRGVTCLGVNCRRDKLAEGVKCPGVNCRRGQGSEGSSVRGSAIGSINC